MAMIEILIDGENKILKDKKYSEIHGMSIEWNRRTATMMKAVSVSSWYHRDKSYGTRHKVGDRMMTDDHNNKNKQR